MEKIGSLKKDAEKRIRIYSLCQMQMRAKENELRKRQN